MSGERVAGLQPDYSKKLDLTAEVCSRYISNFTWLSEQLICELQHSFCLFVSVFLSPPPRLLWEALLRHGYLNSLSFLNRVFFLSENLNSCTSCSCSRVMSSLTSADFWLLGSTVRKHHLPFLCIEICSPPWVLCTWVPHSYPVRS